ncbi:TonB-dependent receptor [Pseudoalteromonas sp. NEC-BIFX-2020_002]|uniref:TonB-dependent receptor domain-containing protein n=1 Tax=Pseudoalteromonas sp. NEC-BIFX-2020_002 TaxID=2732353 RepID=UPI001477003B|nr:TonB-dependent receptor [Pseudoalteromonas sp. NEC-BIFX-2020_002]NNG42111.1 TonB-dependent receptor [Pseudoalteromonas sp. NEC-BIFX-2020_002]
MLIKSTLGVAIAAALSFSASAEQSIERITVTANKFEQSITDVLASVAVIERSDIEQANYRDLPSILNTIAGLDVVRNGGFGQKADVFVRGASAKHALILVNGVRISDGSSGSVSLTNIPVNSIERVEIVKGARAAIYGSDAMAGVINIITRQASNNTVSATLGSDSYSNYQVAGGLVKDAITFNYNLGYEDTDGYDVTGKDPSKPVTKDHDDDGYTNKNIGFNLAYKTDNVGEFSALSQYSEGQGEYDSARGNDAYDFENYIAKLGWKKSSATYTQSASVSLSQEENIQTGTDVQQIYSTERIEFEYSGLYTVTEELDVTGGFNYLNEDLSESSATSSKEKRDNGALFVGVFYDNDTWLGNAVVRTDDYDFHGRANTYTTGIGYRANKSVTVRFNHGTAFRAPSLINAFVTESQWYVQNKNIKPEEAVNNELGVTLETKWGRYDIAIFNNKITNLISNIQHPELSGKYVATNIDRVSMQGVELSADFEGLGFQHNVNLSFLDAKDETTNKDLPRRPSETFNYTLGKNWGNFDANIAMQYRSSRPSASFLATELPAFTVFNIAANYQLLDELSFQVRIENITDKAYFTAGTGTAENGQLLGYNSAGRQFFIGASYQF